MFQCLVNFSLGLRNKQKKKRLNVEFNSSDTQIEFNSILCRVQFDSLCTIQDYFISFTRIGTKDLVFAVDAKGVNNFSFCFNDFIYNFPN